MTSNLVFVVDPSKADRDALGLLLSASGFEPVLLETADQCFAELSRREPLLILMSLHMEPMRGDACCRRIKEDSSWGKIPVIMITQGQQAHELMFCWRAAADDFLPKPVTAIKLAPKLEVLRSGLTTAARPQPHEGRRVLLADGSRFFRTLLGGNLEQAGVEVLYAHDGDEALDLATDNAALIDACLIDLGLLGKDAFVLIAELRKLKALAEKPMLLMSSSATLMSEAAARASALKAELFEKRLVPFETILARVFQALDPPVKELRCAERMPFFTVVEFSDAAGGWASGFSYDVSPGGMFVRTLTPLPPQTRVRLRTSFFGQSSPTVSQGMVAWANRFRRKTAFAAPVGMGVRLTEIDPQLLNQIQGLMKGADAGASR